MIKDKQTGGRVHLCPRCTGNVNKLVSVVQSPQNRALSVRRSQSMAVEALVTTDGRRLQRSGGGGSRPALLELVDVVAELQRGPQLQSQILHHHLAFQQEQSVSIDLLKGTT